MSSPATGGQPPPPEKRGLSKYVHRMRTVLKRRDSKGAATSSIPTEATPSTSQAGTTASPPAQPKKAAETPIITPTTAEKSATKPVKVSRATIEQERARKLAERYGLTLEPQDWKTHQIAERVEKPIRMRIHRTCHKCSTTFGANRICFSCEHVRCTKCPRYPLKKAQHIHTQGDQENAPVVSAPALEAGPLTSDGPDDIDEATKSAVLKRKYRLTKPSRTGGQPLVRKKPMQRVRRYCHMCGNFFHPSASICSKCEHERCADCPRDPAKRPKHPEAFPGDSEPQPSTIELSPPPADLSERLIKRPRPLMRYRCHDCHAEYNRGSDICGQCSHQRCELCVKIGPRVSKDDLHSAGRMEGVEGGRRIPSALRAMPEGEGVGLQGSIEAESENTPATATF